MCIFISIHIKYGYDVRCYKHVAIIHASCCGSAFKLRFTNVHFYYVCSLNALFGPHNLPYNNQSILCTITEKAACSRHQRARQISRAYHRRFLFQARRFFSRTSSASVITWSSPRLRTATWWRFVRDLDVRRNQNVLPVFLPNLFPRFAVKKSLAILFQAFFSRSRSKRIRHCDTCVTSLWRMTKNIKVAVFYQ